MEDKIRLSYLFVNEEKDVRVWITDERKFCTVEEAENAAKVEGYANYCIGEVTGFLKYPRKGTRSDGTPHGREIVTIIKEVKESST